MVNNLVHTLFIFCIHIPQSPNPSIQSLTSFDTRFGVGRNWYMFNKKIIFNMKSFSLITFKQSKEVGVLILLWVQYMIQWNSNNSRSVQIMLKSVFENRPYCSRYRDVFLFFIFENVRKWKKNKFLIQCDFRLGSGFIGGYLSPLWN